MKKPIIPPPLPNGWGIEPLSAPKQGGRRGLPLRRTNDVGETLSGLPRKVEFISESNNRLQLLVKAAENVLLVLSDTYYPGWKAFVDGNPEKIYQANYAFRAVPLNAGTHKVEFVYDPVSFKLGAGVTLLGILGCMAMALFRRPRLRAEALRAQARRVAPTEYKM